MNDNNFVNKLSEWYIADLKKPDINKFERAAIIKNYIDTNKISGREFARRFNLQKSTVEDWLLYNRITEVEANELLEKGMRPIDLYKALRESKGVEGYKVTELDTYLKETKSKVIRYRKALRKECTPLTQQLIQEVVNELNQFSIEINLENKKKNKPAEK